MNIIYIISKLLKKLRIAAIKNSIIHKTSKVCSASTVVNSKIDKYTYIGNNSTIIETEIGSFCSIADNVIIGGASHPLYWVSTSPVFLEGKNILNNNFQKHQYNPYLKTYIENDVWIGNNCLIKSGVKIETGSVIGMGAVLTKNVGPYEIWAGNPAKFIKKRFDEETIKMLLSTNWWSESDSIIQEKTLKFKNILEFLEQYNELR